ncbi:MAG TPA: class I SAM-dependent methyltransferase [Defluviitaleaceae bacterium]|jgi:ubiquinone/menaquinone biosynthesis C-methylase UbiE|nr:class I SAM-dependent methyltransferase [Defluviitaleaceae bacterium]HQD50913.1 class I SAM-dependent methyltransferase [Defluviitaleaceae bacterium]
MSIYSKFIYPFLLERAMTKPSLARIRKELLSNVKGDILEIGFGTGLNLKYYPSHIKEITVIDINDELGKKAQSRINKSSIKVNYKKISADKLPFNNNSFDTIISTFTFCSILDIEKALAELHRVLKPDGKVYFLEHGKSNDKRICFLQNLINPIFKKASCSLNRDIEAIIKNQKYEIIKMNKFYQEDAAKIVGFLYMGLCKKVD